MEPIRVLHVLTIMDIGGAETMVMNYYRNIDRNKVQFDFLVHRKNEGYFDKEIESLGGKIYRLNNIRLTNIFEYQKELNRFFKLHQNYKIVHSHLNALSIFVLKSAKKNNIPIRIAHSHTSLLNVNMNPFSGKRNSLSFIFKFFAQNILKLKLTSYANFYFSCSNKAGVWLYGEKNKNLIQIINNAINTEKYIYNHEKAQLIRNELNIKNEIIIGHVGNFVPEKNHQFILDVFVEVKKINECSKLILVGGGDKTMLEKNTKEKGLDKDVIFLGTRDDVPNLLMAFNVFLFPSTNEGLPVTLIEAQASGLNIIASDEITKEIDITGLINFISLNKSPKYWAKKLLENVEYKRTDTKNKIIKGGYDIKNNALILQDFYCNQLK